MKKTIFTLSLLSGLYCYSQEGNVGINTASPQATLDIVGRPTDTTYRDGIIAPRLTGAELKAKTYTTAQTGAMVYVTAADPLPSGQTVNVTSTGYYYFNGTSWIQQSDKNIYDTDGALAANRTVDMPNRSLAFSPSGTKLTNQFSIDGSTFSVDALNSRVGIGTTTPAFLLHLSSSSSPTLRITNTSSTSNRAAMVLGKSGTTWTVGSDGSVNGGDDFFIFQNSASSSRLVINELGNVGIGTSSPSEKLDVTGNVKFSQALMPNNDAGTAGQALLSGGTGVAPTWSSSFDKTDDAFVNNTASTRVELGTRADGTARTAGTEFVVQDNGNVGVGTTAPTGRMNILGTPQEMLTITRGTTLTGSTGYAGFEIRKTLNSNPLTNTALTDGAGIGGIFFKANNGTASGYANINSSILAFAKGLQSATNSGGILQFRTAPSGSTATQSRLVINDDGNIGIGNLTPVHKLHLGTHGDRIVVNHESDTGTSGIIGFQDQSTTSPNSFSGMVNTNLGQFQFINNSLQAINPTSGGFEFITSGNIAQNLVGPSTPVMVIAKSGNVGIGTRTPNVKLEVTSGVAGNSGIRATDMSSTSASSSQATSSPIGVDTSGNVVRVSSLQASITSSLTTSTLVTSTPTPIAFNVDDNTAFGTITHSTTTNNSRFTVTKAGKYVVFAQPQIQRISTATADCVVWLRKNGTTAISNSAIRYNPNNNNVNIVLPLSVTLDLNANDFIEVMCQTNDNNTYQMTNTAGSGTGATEIPNTPACIIDIKGYFN